MTGQTTAIRRTKLSRPMAYLTGCPGYGLLKGRVLDYGCGRGYDADRLKAEGLDIQGYDPHWRPELPAGQFDTVTCNFVLNVVDAGIETMILEHIRSLLKPDGRAYITVRRDLPREGAKGRGCFQRYVTLDLPSLSIPSRYRREFETYILTK